MKNFRFLLSAVIIEAIGIALICFIFLAKSDVLESWMPSNAKTETTQDASEGAHKSNDFAEQTVDSAMDRISLFTK